VSWNGGDEGGKEEEESKPSLAGAGVAACSRALTGLRTHPSFLDFSLIFYSIEPPLKKRKGNLLYGLYYLSSPYSNFHLCFW
jgi:hypothetical protein